MIAPTRQGVPTPASAAAAANLATSRAPDEVRRFPTGTSHHVFEALFADGGRPVVVRMGTPELRRGLSDGVRLNRLLRPLGAPLPKILAEGLDEPLPWVVLERLPGTDLKHVIGSLSQAQLGAIAGSVAAAQAVAARVGSSGRYGYAAAPGTAPHTRWSDVLRASLARSRARIGAAGLFGSEPVEIVAGLVAARQAELDALPATAFLHDTTTKNVIVASSGTFAGIVDVDDLCFGDPRYAPALTMAVLQAYGGPTGYAEAWMRAAGHRDDRLFRLYVALFLVDLMAEHGQRFNGNERPSTDEARERLSRAFTRAVERLEAP